MAGILNGKTVMIRANLASSGTGGGTTVKVNGVAQGEVLFDSDPQTQIDAKANTADLAAIATSGKLADATGDATHRTVTDTEKTRWDNKQSRSHDFAYGSGYTEGDIVYSKYKYNGITITPIDGALFRCKQTYERILNYSTWDFDDYFEKIAGGVDPISAYDIEKLFTGE